MILHDSSPVHLKNKTGHVPTTAQPCLFELSKSSFANEDRFNLLHYAVKATRINKM